MILKTMETLKKYNDINWKRCNFDLKKMQNNLVVAYKKNDLNLVKQIQNTIVRSFAARALAVRKVSTNRGSKTVGVDGITLNKTEQRMKIIKALSNLKNYTAQPVRRVWIPKLNGKKRPLGIPTVYDRAVQALYLMALSPIAEEWGDSRSYGFRPYRSAKDAAVYLKLVLGSVTATRRWVFLCDVEKYFDNISHDWIIGNILLNKKILKEFLKAGIFEDGRYEESDVGTPQGGIISPTIVNMVLDGLEEALGKEYIVVRYADDFIVLGKTKESLEIEAREKIERFLSTRGVQLNLEKSSIVNIAEGFDYLGFHFREYPDLRYSKGKKQGIILFKPARNKAMEFRKEIKRIVSRRKTLPLYLIISKLNAYMRGWAEYYKCSTAKKIFSLLGAHVWLHVWKMVTSRNRKLGLRKTAEKYFQRLGGNGWVLKGKDPKGDTILLFQMGWVKITRHTMLSSGFNPYLTENEPYYAKRTKSNARSSTQLAKRKSKLLIKQEGICPVCNGNLLNGEGLEVHHRKARKDGGTDTTRNLLLLHKSCHKQITYSKDINLRASWIKGMILIIKYR